MNFNLSDKTVKVFLAQSAIVSLDAGSAWMQLAKELRAQLPHPEEWKIADDAVTILDVDENILLSKANSRGAIVQAHNASIRRMLAQK